MFPNQVLATRKPKIDREEGERERGVVVEMGGTDLRCVHCGVGVRRLLVQYSPGNIRLMKCDNCKRVADPYVECEFMIIFIDLILHKQKAYRHLLYNTLNEDVVAAEGLLWKSTLTYLILDGTRCLFLSKLTENSQSPGSSSFPIWTYIRVILAVLVGNFMLVATLFCVTQLLLHLLLDSVRYKGVFLAIIFSSYFKIFLIALFVWKFPSSVIYIIDIFVLSSNAVALKGHVLVSKNVSFSSETSLGKQESKIITF